MKREQMSEHIAQSINMSCTEFAAVQNLPLSTLNSRWRTEKGREQVKRDVLAYGIDQLYEVYKNGPK